jgi:hypothetical protein
VILLAGNVEEKEGAVEKQGDDVENPKKNPKEDEKQKNEGVVNQEDIVKGEDK